MQRPAFFSFGLQRVKGIMGAIAQALAYRDFGRAYIGEWRVFCATLHSREPAPNWDNLRNMLSAAVYQSMPVPVPDVFQYGVHHTHPVGFIYQLVFYQGFVVYAWPVITTSA
jgi:hypothetical protein